MSLVRIANHSDSEVIFLMAKAMATSFEVNKPDFLTSFNEIITENDSICLVAEIEEKIIGYLIGFDHRAFFANGRVSWVEEIYVVENFRRRGIGKKLMDEFEEWNLKRGSKLIALATRRASDFYSAIGYEESATYFRKLL